MKNSPLKAALIELGFKTKHDRGVELWRMFYHTYKIMCEIADEIERNEKE